MQLAIDLLFCFYSYYLCGRAARQAYATVTYWATVDTHSVLGKNGYLDLELEPGPVGTNLTNAVVTQFTTDGALSGVVLLTGDVAGQLPGAHHFDNQTIFNDYFQMVQFGGSESFFITLDGPTPTGGGASVFNIAFYASDGSTPLLTTSPDGEVGQILINSNGQTTPIVYAVSPGERLCAQPWHCTTPSRAGAGILTLGWHSHRRIVLLQMVVPKITRYKRRMFVSAARFETCPAQDLGERHSVWN